MRSLSVHILTNKESSIKQQVGIPAKLSNDHIHGSPVSLLRNRAAVSGGRAVARRLAIRRTAATWSRGRGAGMSPVINNQLASGATLRYPLINCFNCPVTVLTTVDISLSMTDGACGVY